MALRTARLRPGGRTNRRRLWQTGRLAGLSSLIALGTALSGALGGCSPVDTWRSLSGIDKNDPDPQTALFTRNLAKAEAEPYPNLASVPPPPTLATSTAERQKLTQSLVADRSATAAEAGPVSPGPATVAAGPTPAPSSKRASGQVATGPASPGPADVIPAPTTASSIGRTSGTVPTAPVAPAAGAPPHGRPASTSTTASAAPPSGIRRAGEPPAPQPRESCLEMPQIPSLPQPETARPAPPPPVLPAVSAPAPAAGPPPAAIASVIPRPAPPVPDMAPPAAPPAPVKAAPKHAPAATTVATLELTTASATSSTTEQVQIDRVAALYKENPGIVRVLAYAAPPAPGSDPITSYRAALDRAQAVARALAAAGIPANKIQTEADPALGARAAGRIEIQFAP